jgi:flagellar motor switch protein FliM
MQIVQETLARGFTTTLASALRAVTQVSIREIDQRPYDEYVRELPNPTLLTMLSLAPLSGSAILQLPLRVAFAATELMLGGRGGPDQPKRAMTDLELSLMRSIVAQSLPEIRYAFEPVVAIEADIIGQEANPQFAQLAAPTDMVIVVAFDVRVETVNDTMTLCIPFSSLQPHLEALSASARTGVQSEAALAKHRQLLHDHVVDSNVDTAARFRPVVASSRQITSLQVGDLMLLNHPVDMPLTLDVGGVPTHEVRIGRLNRQFALQVVGTTEPGRRQHRSRLAVTPATVAPSAEPLPVAAGD